MLPVLLRDVTVSSSSAVARSVTTGSAGLNVHFYCIDVLMILFNPKNSPHITFQ